MKLIFLVFVCFLGIFYSSLNFAAANTVSSTQNNYTRNGKQIQLPFFSWLFGNPVRNDTSENKNITTHVPTNKKTQDEESLEPFEKVSAKNSTFQRLVLKKDAQKRLNDQIYLHNQDGSVTHSADQIPSASVPKKDERTGRSLRGEILGYEDAPIYVPNYERSHINNHHKQQFRSSGVYGHLDDQHSASQLQKRQGLFSMSMTPQQQMYLQAAALQQQQLMALNGFGTGNSVLAYRRAAYGNANGNTRRRRRKPSSYDYEYDDSDYDEEYDSPDSDEFDSDELFGSIRSDNADIPLMPPMAMSDFAGKR